MLRSNLLIQLSKINVKKRKAEMLEEKQKYTHVNLKKGIVIGKVAFQNTS